MNDMTSLMILMGAHMPDEFLIGKIKEAIELWEKNKSDENKARIEMHCMLLLAGEAGKTHEAGPNALIKEIEADKAMLQMVNPDRNKC